MKSILHQSGQRFHFGRNIPAIHHSKLPRFANLRDAALPNIVVPTTQDYSAPAMPGLRAIYRNDVLGCCVVASEAHTINIQQGQAGKPVTVFTDPQIGVQYGLAGGYVEGDPSTDQGCDEVSALTDWQTNAWPDESENIGWVQIDATNDLETAQALVVCKAIIYCACLPGQWQASMPTLADGTTWDLAGPPDPNAGHSFMSFGRDASGNDILDTWALFPLMTPEARRFYPTPAQGGGCYAVMTTDGITQAGYNKDQVLQFFAAWRQTI
jgi:hypothetical protein